MPSGIAARALRRREPHARHKRAPAPATWEMERLVESVANMQQVVAGEGLVGQRKSAPSRSEYKSITTMSEWGIATESKRES